MMLDQMPSESPSRSRKEVKLKGKVNKKKMRDKSKTSKLFSANRTHTTLPLVA